MRKIISVSIALLACAALSFAGNAKSPAAETTVTINGKVITIKYSAPSLRGRPMFGPEGRISKDPTYPVWRAGADDETAFHTEADLVFGKLTVPKGDYSIFALVNGTPWQLIISKQTGKWGLDYDATLDLGRVPMTMKKPAAPIETFKITLNNTGGGKGMLQMEWENVIATAPFTVK